MDDLLMSTLNDLPRHSDYDMLMSTLNECHHLTARRGLFASTRQVSCAPSHNIRSVHTHPPTWFPEMIASVICTTLMRKRMRLECGSVGRDLPMGDTCEMVTQAYICCWDR